MYTINNEVEMSDLKEKKKEIRKFNALIAVNNIPTKQIFFNETDYFEVRGLSTRALSLLTATYPQIANYMIEGLIISGDTKANPEAIISDMIEKAPTLGAFLIGLCTRNEDDSDDNFENSHAFMDFSPVVIADAVTEIFNLTKPSTSAQEKKILAMLSKLKDWLMTHSASLSTQVADTV